MDRKKFPLFLFSVIVLTSCSIASLYPEMSNSLGITNRPIDWTTDAFVLTLVLTIALLCIWLVIIFRKDLSEERNLRNELADKKRKIEDENSKISKELETLNSKLSAEKNNFQSFMDCLSGLFKEYGGKTSNDLEDLEKDGIHGISSRLKTIFDEQKNQIRKLTTSSEMCLAEEEKRNPISDKEADSRNCDDEIRRSNQELIIKIEKLERELNDIKSRRDIVDYYPLTEFLCYILANFKNTGKNPIVDSFSRSTFKDSFQCLSFILQNHDKTVLEYFASCNNNMLSIYREFYRCYTFLVGVKQIDSSGRFQYCYKGDEEVFFHLASLLDKFNRDEGVKISVDYTVPFQAQFDSSKHVRCASYLNPDINEVLNWIEPVHDTILELQQPIISSPILQDFFIEKMTVYCFV